MRAIVAQQAMGDIGFRKQFVQVLAAGDDPVQVAVGVIDRQPLQARQVGMMLGDPGFPAAEAVLPALPFLRDAFQFPIALLERQAEEGRCELRISGKRRPVRQGEPRRPPRTGSFVSALSRAAA